MFADGSKERLHHISEERSANGPVWRSLLFDDPDTFDRNNIEHALRLLQLESHARRPLLRDDCRLPIGFVAGVVVTVLVLGTLGEAKSAILPVSMLLGFGLFMIGLTRLATSRRQRDAIHRLTQYDDLRSIGPLLDAIHWPETDVRLAARATLFRLLPNLRTEHAGCFDAWWHYRLCRALRLSDPALSLAALSALCQVGDERAVPHIERLMTKRGRRPIDARVAETAAACLPIVRSRKPPISVNLLRPAVIGVDISLLRATVPESDRAVERLVRPLQDESDLREQLLSG